MSDQDSTLNLEYSPSYDGLAHSLDYLDDEHGLLGMPASQQPGSVASFTHASQQSFTHASQPPFSHASQQSSQPPCTSDALNRLSCLARVATERGFDAVPRPIHGRCGLLLSVFTSGNILQKPTSRTRLCALKFSDAPDARTEFVHSLIGRLKDAKGRRRQNFGFDVRSVTFVVEGEFIWVVLIGLTALSFNKWHRIFVRVDAVDIKVVCIHRQGKIGTQTSLETAADMMGSLTTLEELARNEIVCEIDEETLAKAAGKKRDEAPKRREEAPPSKKRKQSPPAAQPVEPTPAPAEELVQECLAFLTSKDMPPVEPHHARLLQHAHEAQDHGQIGAFLLSHRPLELFARVVHLRMAVIRVLRHLYGIDAPGSFSTASLLDNDGYKNVPPANQSALRMISKCMDNARDFPIFALLDMGGVVALISLYIAHQALERDEGEVLFLDSYRSIVVEQLWWLVTIGCRMSQYLSMEAEAGLDLEQGETDLLFPDPGNELQALLAVVEGFPVIQHIIRSHDRASFSLKARYKFYKAKPAVSIKRVMQGFGITKFGKALDAFHVAQESSSLFYVALSDSPLYKALPATVHSDDPAGHVEGLGDADALARVCARLRAPG